MRYYIIVLLTYILFHAAETFWADFYLIWFCLQQRVYSPEAKKKTVEKLIRKLKNLTKKKKLKNWKNFNIHLQKKIHCGPSVYNLIKPTKKTPTRRKQWRSNLIFLFTRRCDADCISFISENVFVWSHRLLAETKVQGFELLFWTFILQQ